MAKRITAGRYTVCLDTREHKCNEDSYRNWETFRLRRMVGYGYRLERLTNDCGNGQDYEGIGWIHDGELLAGWVVDGRPVACLTILARYFGLTYAGETVARFPRSRVFKPKGKRTAAPTLLRSHVRDKNRNNMREHVARIDMAAAMAGRKHA